jgi:fructokinase
MAARSKLDATRSKSDKTPSILSCGYVALDTLVSENVLAYTAGGTAANVAAALSFFVWDSAVAATVGGDEAGARLRRDLARAGVSTRLIHARADALTPQVIHEVLDRGPRYHFRCYECGRKLGKSQPPPEALADLVLEQRQDPDVFFFDRASRFSVRLAEEYASRETLVMFEPATRGRPELVARAYRAANIVKVAEGTQTDIGSLLRHKDGRIFILTRGANGARLRDSAGKVVTLSAHPALSLVDSGGAGDWTTAGFLHALLREDRSRRAWRSGEVIDALRWGQAVAALSCGWRGARGIARHRQPQEVTADAQALLDGGEPSHSVRERFSAQVSAALCRICLAPPQLT